ncbi:hypothetical protein L1887_51842 [Cichorium endivia]|nr:hypothetical protein L1887_51842 [Cichorium endivia]
MRMPRRKRKRRSHCRWMLLLGRQRRRMKPRRKPTLVDGRAAVEPARAAEPWGGAGPCAGCFREDQGWRERRWPLKQTLVYDWRGDP